MKLNSVKTAINWSLTSLALVGFIFLSNPLFSQKGNKNQTNDNEKNNNNLVKNGSFENLINKKPKKLGGISTLDGWFSATGVKADTYRDDTKTPTDSKERSLIGSPQNTFGFEEPYDGMCYVGISAYLTGKNQNARSFLTGELTTKLTKNKTYCVEFWISLAEGSKFACNNIGAKFDQKQPDEKSDKQLMKGNVDVLHPENKIFNSANGWFKICGTYLAKGGEEYISIGNFKTNAETEYEPFKKSKQAKATAIQSAYYYIDNVIVREQFTDFESYLKANEIDISVLSEDEESEERGKFSKIEPCTCFTKAIIDTDSNYSNLTYQKEFIVEDMKADEKIKNYQVFFSAGSAALTNEANITIEEIANILKANPSFKLKIVGHSDTVEYQMSKINKPEYIDVDKKRAESVKEKLISLGVKNMISTDSQAAKIESDFVSGEADEKEIDWAKNRRVEFVVEKK